MPLVTWAPSRGSLVVLAGPSRNNGAGGKGTVRGLRSVPLSPGDRLLLGTGALLRPGGPAGENSNRLHPLIEGSVQRKIHLVKRKVLRKLFNWGGESPGPPGVSSLIVEVGG